MKMYIILLLSTIHVFSPQARAAETCVILLHGLARTHYSMSKLEFLLKQNNYIVINRDYPSTKKSIQELADYCIPPMIDECLKFDVNHINFVTHSLGGLILQKYLQNHKIEKLERVVMLSPPNHGSPLADLFHNNVLYHIIMGPAGQELTTQQPNLMSKLNQQYQIGVIAGTLSLNPFSQFLFSEPNDGTVGVSSTKMKNMKDFIELPVSHSFMMQNALVGKQVLNFFRYGSFTHYVPQNNKSL